MGMSAHTRCGDVTHRLYADDRVFVEVREEHRGWSWWVRCVHPEHGEIDCNTESLIAIGFKGLGFSDTLADAMCIGRESAIRLSSDKKLQAALAALIA